MKTITEMTYRKRRKGVVYLRKIITHEDGRGELTLEPTEYRGYEGVKALQAEIDSRKYLEENKS